MAGFLAEDSSVCQQERTSRPLGSMESVAASSGQESRIWAGEPEQKGVTPVPSAPPLRASRKPRWAELISPSLEASSWNHSFPLAIPLPPAKTPLVPLWAPRLTHLLPGAVQADVPDARAVTPHTT